jgi:hypothetical protein
MSEAEAEPVAAEPEAAEAPAAEPEAPAAEPEAPAAEPEAAPEPEPEPEKAAEPEAEPEEEVEEAAAVYKNVPHKQAKQGAPFDATAPGNHPFEDSADCKLLDNFTKSSTLWVSWSACSGKEGYVKFEGMGGSVKELKDSLNGKQQKFYLLKCRARDIKDNVVSERCRIIRITQLGSSVPVMKRRFKSGAWTYFSGATNGCQMDKQLTETDECDWLSWMKDIRKNGGAHQPTEFAFGPDETWKP